MMQSSLHGSERLKVCCFPIRVKGNEGLSIIYAAFSKSGVELIEYDWLFCNFRRFDVFHVHWPDAVVMGRSKLKALLKTMFFAISVLIMLLRRTPIAYSVHNIGSNDKLHQSLEAWIWRFFIPKVDLFVHMNEASVRDFLAWQPRASRQHHVVIPHPHYRSVLEALRSKQDARAAMGLPFDALVFLTFGLMRPYKGVEVLIDSFRKFSHADAVLIIAGKPVDAAYRQRLAKLAEGDPRIQFRSYHIPSCELNDLLAACDAVVISHRKLNNSGVALVALSASRHLIGPRRGALIDFEKWIGKDWLTLFDDEITPMTLASAVDGLLKCHPSGQPNLTELEPELVAAKLKRHFLDLKQHRAVM